MIARSMRSFNAKNKRRAQNDGEISKLRNKFLAHLQQNIQRRSQILAELQKIQRSMDGILHSSENTDKNGKPTKLHSEEAKAKLKRTKRNLNKKKHNYEELIRNGKTTKKLINSYRDKIIGLNYKLESLDRSLKELNQIYALSRDKLHEEIIDEAEHLTEASTDNRESGDYKKNFTSHFSMNLEEDASSGSHLSFKLSAVSKFLKN